MATFTAINCKHQSGGAMRGTLDYVSQKKKTLWGNAQLVVGHNCVPQSAYTEMLTTKQQFRKTEGRQFYHFVQSFAEDDPITPAEANAIGLELAQCEFLGFEVVIATDVDTNHIHNHLVVNSVSCVDGKKLPPECRRSVGSPASQRRNLPCPWAKHFGATGEAVQNETDEARRVPGRPLRRQLEAGFDPNHQRRVGVRRESR